MNQNDILRRVRYILDLDDSKMMSIFSLGGSEVTRAQVSAFFRKPEHKHFRACKDQVLRNFLKGLQLKYLGTGDSVFVQHIPGIPPTLMNRSPGLVLSAFLIIQSGRNSKKASDVSTRGKTGLPGQDRVNST
jgi:hypothetical protein